jgi:hypothetical protein
MTVLQELSSPPAANAEVQVNENFETVSAAGAFGKKHSTTSGLTWGYYGARYNGNTIADGTVTLTNASDNYVVVLRSTGVVSVSTTDTNATNPLYARLYKLTTAGSVVTVELDERWETNGLLFNASGAAGTVTSVAASVPAFLSIAGSPITSSGTLAISLSGNALPVASGGTGITSFGTGVATFLGTPSSANLAAAVTDETGTGALVFAGSPALTGSPTAPTQSASDNSTKIATTAYVDNAVSGLGSSGITWNAQTGTSYTLVLGDANNGVTMDNAAANTLTVPPNSSVAVPVGSSVVVAQKGAGQTTIDEGVGVTLLVDASLTLDLFAQYSVVSLLKIATDTWIVSGSLTPVDETTAIQQNIQSAAYTLVLADRGKCIHHPASDANNRTFTIPANSSVAYDVGTVISFSNEVNTVTIAITTDTLTWAADNSSGSRSLAAGGVATAMKITSTKWLISGVGLT